MSDLTEAERQALRSVPAEMIMHSPEEFYAEIESVVRAIAKTRESSATQRALLEAAADYEEMDWQSAEFLRARAARLKNEAMVL